MEDVSATNVSLSNGVFENVTIIAMKITIRKVFKFRLSPSADQAQQMLQYAGINRFVWNKALAMNLFRLEHKKPMLWYNELDFWTKLWKQSEEYSFIKEAPAQTLQQTLKNLERAFKDAFDKTQPLKRIPRFKKRGASDSFRFPQGFKLEQQANSMFLPKLGWVRYRNSRHVVGDVKNITVSRKNNHWYASVQVEYETESKYHTSSSIIGIDMGIKRFATLSDGSYVAPLNSFKQLSQRLAFLQRQLSRKVKFSANWKKCKQKIGRLHERIANARRDFLHKASTIISKNHAMIVLEDLKVKNMSKSTKGDRENPGKNVKAKSGLNRSILDQGWAAFVQMLEYKQSWLGGTVLKIDPKHTSQICPKCNHKDKDNRKTQERFKCVSCHYTNNADRVAALNILARGHRVLACGDVPLGKSMKQEPARTEIACV